MENNDEIQNAVKECLSGNCSPASSLLSLELSTVLHSTEEHILLIFFQSPSSSVSDFVYSDWDSVLSAKIQISASREIVFLSCEIVMESACMMNAKKECTMHGEHSTDLQGLKPAYKASI